MSYRFRALVEDRDHEQLIRGLLDRRQLSRAVRFEPYPPGRGSAEQRVREHFAEFVRELRTRRNQQTLWGLVVLDGDVEGASKRRAGLLGALEPTLSTEDRVILLIPTRNVQTWAWCLLGHSVNEQDDYKARLTEPLRQLFSLRWEPAQPAEPQSLIDGRAEWQRLSLR